MDIKDSLVRLYVKKYVMPRALIFDKPGFVDFKISGKTNVFARQFLFPERLFVEFEAAIVKEFGDAGAQLLYSIGKKFGYSFAQLGRFENIRDHPGEGVKDWVVIATKFVEGTYASNISQSIDVSSKSVDYILSDFVITGPLGYDYFLATGGAAGVVAWILQDSNIDGFPYGSEVVNGVRQVKVLCAPQSVLSARFPGKKLFKEPNLAGLETDAANYNAFNAEVDLGDGKSFQSYLDSRIFDYRGGKITYGGERFFLLEATALYLFELSLNQKQKALLADAAFSTGKLVFGSFGAGSVASLAEFLTALGWGKVSILGSSKSTKVIVEHYPWTKYSDQVDFIIASNLIAGALSKIYGQAVSFKAPVRDVSKGYLTLLFKSS